MSFNSAMLEQMKAEGLDLDACIRIVKASEKKADPTNAVRQARHRAKRKEAKAEDNAVTVTGVTVSPNEDILTPSEPPSVISDEITPPIADPPTLVLEAYNLMAGEAGLPKARMTPERRKKLRTFTARHKVEDITEAIWAIPRTPFLCGENDRGWKADFDFLLQPKSFTRILEGSYGG